MLTAAASETDGDIQKRVHCSGATALIISYEQMEDIMKIVKALKEQTGGFLGMLLNTLGASLLGNILAGKGAIRASEGTIRTGHNF